MLRGSSESQVPQVLLSTHAPSESGSTSEAAKHRVFNRQRCQGLIKTQAGRSLPRPCFLPPVSAHRSKMRKAMQGGRCSYPLRGAHRGMAGRTRRLRPPSVVDGRAVSKAGWEVVVASEDSRTAFKDRFFLGVVLVVLVILVVVVLLVLSPVVVVLA